MKRHSLLFFLALLTLTTLPAWPILTMAAARSQCFRKPEMTLLVTFSKIKTVCIVAFNICGKFR
nr:Uncharacterised protein [Salmonella sp. NCTC 7297]